MSRAQRRAQNEDNWEARLQKQVKKMNRRITTDAQREANRKAAEARQRNKTTLNGFDKIPCSDPCWTQLTVPNLVRNERDEIVVATQFFPLHSKPLVSSDIRVDLDRIYEERQRGLSNRV